MDSLKKIVTILIIGGMLASCETKKQADDENQEQETKELLGSDAEIKDNQRVYFIAPEDGAEVQSPVNIQMGIEGMEVEPAGELAKDKGHHHILINHDANPKGAVVAADSTHIHFGKGQTETELELAPGNYKLTLQFADGFHRSYGPKMSQSINITVVE